MKNPDHFDESENYSLVWRREFVRGIPVLSCRPQNGNLLPLVVLSHGFTGSKEMWREPMARIGRMGCLAVALDNRGHGERSGSDFHSTVFRDGRLSILEVRRLIKETADDIPELIDHTIRSGVADPERIGLIGVSMGGFAAFRAVVTDKRIGAAAPIVASPYWDELPAEEVRFEDGDEEGMRRLRAYAADHSPAGHPDRFFPTALLVQIGRTDRHSRIERVLDFIRTLRPLYAENPERLELILHPGGHDFTGAMQEKALEWMSRFLAE